jgi:hypothetical protein
VLPGDLMARVTERKMFGGLAFMLDGNVLVGPGALDDHQLTGGARGALDFVGALPPKAKNGPGKARRSTARS